MKASSTFVSVKLWAVLIFFRFSVDAKSDLNFSKLVWAKDIIVLSSCEEKNSLG